MKEFVFAGFGGQGVLTSGLILADVALRHNLHATWIPSYGPEMRGGKAYCTMKYDSRPIGAPTMEELDVLVAMNVPSLDFQENMRAGGMILLNSDQIDKPAERITRKDVRVLELPCDALAREVNNIKGANVVVVGAITALFREDFEEKNAEEAVLAFFEKKGKAKYAEANRAAFQAGYRYIEKRV